MSIFKKATKTQIKLRLALSGPSGSGKTFSALAIASNLGQRRKHPFLEDTQVLGECKKRKKVQC